MIKKGVKIDKLQPQMTLGYVIIQRVFNRHGWECVITSGNDGKHSEDSLHYVGLALDIRTKNIPQCYHDALTNEIREALGENYDIVYENDHWHTEYDPKY